MCIHKNTGTYTYTDKSYRQRGGHTLDTYGQREAYAPRQRQRTYNTQTHTDKYAYRKTNGEREADRQTDAHGPHTQSETYSGEQSHNGRGREPE